VLELVVRSELSTTALTRIIATPADPLRRSAARELSARLARQGKWAEAARFATQGDPSRKRLWSSAAQLATRPGGELALARFLVSNAGELFFKERSAFYRGLSTHYAGLPLGSKARANIDAAMTRGSARWIALELFTAWLEQHPNHPNARSVLAEADAQFVVLTNFGGGNYFYWGTIAQTSPVIKRLRRIGKLVRKP
jgi:hypothetical protein